MLIIIIVIIGLSLLILLHEAGHFFAAKLFGIKVEEFGFGFPPRIGAKKIGETEYSFNWLLFGGFVRISGERGEFALADSKQASESKSGEDSSAAENTENIEIVKSENTDPSRLFFPQPSWKKSIIILAGVLMNFILGWLLISTALMVGTPKALVISAVEPGSPAQAANLQANDLIQGYSDAQAFINYVNANKGTPITFEVERNDKDIQVTATPRVQAPANQGALGVALVDAGSPAENPFAALHDGFLDSFSLSVAILGALWGLITQLFVHASLEAGVVGPVGIFGVAQETGEIGLIYLVQFLGIISLNLAVVNLIPFPALDGGRFLLILIEKIKGSPVPEKVEVWINGAGFAFLLLLMLLLTVRDVTNLW